MIVRPPCDSKLKVPRGRAFFSPHRTLAKLTVPLVGEFLGQQISGDAVLEIA